MNLSRGKLYVLAERYSSALYELALVHDQVVQIVKDIENLKELSHLPLFQYCILSPQIPFTQKNIFLDNLNEKLNMHQLTRNFLKVIAKNKRLFMLSLICQEFLYHAQQEKDHFIINVTTAQPLTVKSRSKIKKDLEKVLDHPIVLNLKLDPQILRGSILQIGSVMIDSSIKTTLKRLKQGMNGACT